MGIFDKLFGSGTKKNPERASSPTGNQDADTEKVKSILAATQMSFSDLAAQKDNLPKLTDEEAMRLFAEYFTPNTEFFSAPGSPKSNAYFSAVNAAKAEMAKNPQLFNKATKRDVKDLVEHINNPQPVISNILICGMIFRMGEYAVIKSAVYCVDFCEQIPNCIALYLLLIAQKEPERKRSMTIDAGDNSNKTAFRKAVKSLEILDPYWKCDIH